MGNVIDFRHRSGAGQSANGQTQPQLPDEETIIELFMTPWRQLETCSSAYLAMAIDLEQAAACFGAFTARRCRKLLSDYLELRSRLFWELIPVMERLCAIYLPRIGNERGEAAGKGVEIVFIALMEAELIGNRIYMDIDEQIAAGTISSEWFSPHILAMAHILERLKSFYAWFSEVIASTSPDGVAYAIKAINATWRVMDERYGR
jgi:hypothetical protein